MNTGSPSYPTFGSTGSPGTAKAFVVFDSASGHIHHIHQVVTFEGGDPPADAAQRALHIAREHVSEAARRAIGYAPTPLEGALDVIEVDPAALGGVRRSRVEPATRTLVQVEPGAA